MAPPPSSGNNLSLGSSPIEPTDEAQSGAARSGNRPKFKMQQTKRNNNNHQNNHQADTKTLPNIKRTREQRELKSWVRSLLLVAILLTLSSVSADRKWPGGSSGGSRGRRAAASKHLRRAPNFLEGQWGAQDEERMKVAALATKLEQWLTCRRLNLELEFGLASARNKPTGAAEWHSTFSGCAAHYDGHLCWPPTRVNETASVECPQLSGWQSPQTGSQQHQPVITSIQPAAEEEDARTSGSSRRGAETNDKTTTIVSSARPGQSKRVIQFGKRKCFARTKTATNDQQSATTISNEASVATETIRSHQSARVAQQEPEVSGQSAASETQVARIVGEWQSEAEYGACRRATNQEQAADSDISTAGSSFFFDPTDKWIKLDTSAADKRLFDSLVLELDRIEGNIDPYSDPDLEEQWTMCIAEIMRHQANGNQQPAAKMPYTTDTSATNNSISSQADSLDSEGDIWCPIIFDGWRCWPSTRASETAYVGCPKNQPGFSAERKAHKICTPDGTWYRHPMTNRYWSNYTTCVDTVDLAFRTKILNLYVSGNLISLIALGASLIIFISFKSLNCTRVTIHKNLFLSFITNNLMWIIWYTYVVNNATLLQNNPIECQIWHILLHYFLVSNYFWMFCEGLYLHTLLVVAFVSEDKILKWFYLLGWLTPVPITAAYAYNRYQDEYYTNYCWMDESPYNLILMAPIGISLLLNLVFLINIVRVLVTKLRANNSPDTHQTRKAVRATLILIPLLGLHYILTPFRPEAKSEWEVIYESVAAICTSFQGLCVALLFCFCNGEVINAIKKKLKDTFNLGHRHHRNQFDYNKKNSGGDSNNKNNNNGSGEGKNDGFFRLPRSSHQLNQEPGFRSRSDTTCTGIGVLVSQQQQFPVAANGTSHLAAGATGSCPVATGGNALLLAQRGSVPAAAATSTATGAAANCRVNPLARPNGADSNTSNSSSLLTTITVSPIATNSNVEFAAAASTDQELLPTSLLLADDRSSGSNSNLEQAEEQFTLPVGHSSNKQQQPLNRKWGLTREKPIANNEEDNEERVGFLKQVGVGNQIVGQQQPVGETRVSLTSASMPF